jgi:hypothetical protein
MKAHLCETGSACRVTEEPDSKARLGNSRKGPIVDRTGNLVKHDQKQISVCVLFHLTVTRRASTNPACQVKLLQLSFIVSAGSYDKSRGRSHGGSCGPETP